VRYFYPEKPNRPNLRRCARKKQRLLGVSSQPPRSRSVTCLRTLEPYVIIL